MSNHQDRPLAFRMQLKPGVAAEYVEFKGGGHSDLILQERFAPTIAAFFDRVER